MRSALSLYAYAALGLFLVAAPWSPVWSAVTMPLAPTPLGEWVQSGCLRGFVSGLGVLNLAAAAAEVRWLWRALRSPVEGSPLR